MVWDPISIMFMLENCQRSKTETMIDQRTFDTSTKKHHVHDKLTCPDSNPTASMAPQFSKLRVLTEEFTRENTATHWIPSPLCILWTTSKLEVKYIHITDRNTVVIYVSATLGERKYKNSRPHCLLLTLNNQPAAFIHLVVSFIPNPVILLTNTWGDSLTVSHWSPPPLLIINSNLFF